MIWVSFLSFFSNTKISSSSKAFNRRAECVATIICVVLPALFIILATDRIMSGCKHDSGSSISTSVPRLGL